MHPASACRGSPSASATSPPCAASTSRSAGASSSPCSARAAAARRPRCAWSPASRSRPRAGSCSTATTWRACPPFKRPTNTVFQSYALFPHLSVEDNVAFGLERQKVDKAEVRRRVAEELERVGLAAEADAQAALSCRAASSSASRWRARWSTGRPCCCSTSRSARSTSSSASGLQMELKRIQREVGITFIYVTHDQEEALTMSDRIAVMNNGVVEQVGATRGRSTSARRRTFVAGFIGVSNLMPGEVVRPTGAARAASRQRARWCGGRLRGAGAGSACHAVVRPGEAEGRPVEAGAATAPERRGPVRGLALPRHGDADDRPAAGRHPDDRAGAEHRRGGAPAAARCRATRRG